MTNSTQIPNRLINETSPYLLQHAYNPVDWWPWCDEAFAKAKAEDKPVFLSIGYSTCHWCHVMEDESFIDAEVAERLNADFISIKVDKEERPDIDAVYMTVCQALTGSGGWPTTILMTHEQKPFFAGTYFPKHNRYGHIGLLELLAAVKKKWDEERETLIESGDKISRLFADSTLAGSASKKQDAHRTSGKEALEKAVTELRKSYDKQYGGFGNAPKFPMPHNLMFLLRCHSLSVSDDALGMVERTLTQMYRGGIFDHIGGGFSRYSTDKEWLAPHFEKMLYDNALLAIAFLECFEATKDALYRTVTEKIFLYLSREMTSEAGGFYSAQDADSDGEEGKYYTFTPKELAKVLGENDAGYFCRVYDITESGNFESKNIPNLIAGDEMLLPDERTQIILDRLYLYRKDRFGLHKDDKIITSWNALMIASLAKAYRILDNEKHLDDAIRALNFIFENLTDGSGNLFISYRDGKVKGSGVLDDYAFLAWACLELYEAAFELCYLETAVLLAEKILANFSDEAGGFYLNANNSEKLLFRTKEQFDGAIPSGNSVAAYVLVKLAALTAEKRWIDAADKQLAFYTDMFDRQPTACTFALFALMYRTYPARELVCVFADESDKEAVASELRGIFLPQTSILFKTPGEAERLAGIAPFTKEYTVPKSEKFAFYFCSGGACRAPVYDLNELKKFL